MRGLLATLFVLALHGSALAETRLALHPLQSEGTSAEAMQQLDAALRIELARIRGLEVVEPTRDAPRDCKGETACLQRLGRIVGAQEVLYGEVRGMPDSYSVTLRLLEVSTGKELGRSAGSTNRDVEEMVWAIRGQLARLKAPERFAGRLLVDCPEKTTVTVNGTKVVPRHELTLKAGLHELSLDLKGKPLQSWVEVRFEQVATATLRGDPPHLEVAYAPWSTPERVEFSAVAAPRKAVPDDAIALTPLAPIPADPGFPKWPGFVALGAGVALAAGGVFELVQARSLKDEILEMQVNGAVPPESHARAVDKMKAMDQAQTIGFSLVGVGAAALLGGSLYLFLAPGPQGGQVAVAGRF